MLLQAHRDSVRIAMSTLQPALSNTAFHTLGGGDAPLKIDGVDVNVWALSMTDRSSLVVTEFTPLWHDVVPSITVTDIDHKLIHLGLAFIASEVLKGAAAIPSGGTADFVIVNPTAFEVHLKDFEFKSTEGNAELIFYKGVTSSDDGSSVPLNNKHFDSLNTSDAIMQLDPTTVSIVGATHIQHFELTGGKKIGGLAGSGVEEYVLKQNEKCLLRYTNNAVSSDTVDYKLTALNIGRMPGV